MNHHSYQQNRPSQPNQHQQASNILTLPLTVNSQPNPRLFDENAQKYVSTYLKGKISDSQVRKFFSVFKSFEMKLRSIEDKDKREKLFEKIKSIEIPLLVAKAKYLHSNSQTGLDRSFVDFIESAQKRIRTSADFLAFVNHFEFIVAWKKFFDVNK